MDTVPDAGGDVRGRSGGAQVEEPGVELDGFVIRAQAPVDQRPECEGEAAQSLALSPRDERAYPAGGADVLGDLPRVAARSTPGW
ncbi:hypothetical protein ACIBI8_19410 [Streptomyces sp. NPDC050529]|uniref:hypothetical protein n=1 Tax=unclassified Streptomyces TaxID=2593676 RepID=UPI002DDB3D8D|nr:hypothetical protein [Streptomyces sp. NBC_01022]WRZ82077.1 hypothetical protein OG316_18315 [Streptomyces sp. NBC_01022]